METTRQKKISKLLQKDIAEILQNKLKKQGNYGVLLSITKVSVTVDFSVAKILVRYIREISDDDGYLFIIRHIN